MNQLWRFTQFALSIFVLFGCGDSDGGGDADASVEAGMDAVADVSVPDASPPDAAVPQDICDRLGLPRVLVKSTGRMQIAGDFTVDELGGGTWNLEREWTDASPMCF